ncbi:MAG: Penicillinase repressor [Pseudomonadota bacterium]|jgi:predicted transcriptional regulator
MASMKEIIASISDAEVEVLRQLWEEAPLSAQGIIERMEKSGNAHPKTIKTLINRLLNKGALRYKEENRKYLYIPVVRKADFYRLKTESFLNKFFDGELSPLVSFFSSQKKLSDKQIEELRQLVDKLEADNDD